MNTVLSNRIYCVEKAVSISAKANNLGKGIHRTIPRPAMDK